MFGMDYTGSDDGSGSVTDYTDIILVRGIFSDNKEKMAISCRLLLKM